MQIAWIDDEIPKLTGQINTTRLLGHKVTPFQRIKPFMDFLENPECSSVDMFFVDLMMKIDKDSLAKIRQTLKNSDDYTDSGILLIKYIRTKYKKKPIVVITQVTFPPSSLFAQDKKIVFYRKAAKIKPILDKITTLLEG